MLKHTYTMLRVARIVILAYFAVNDRDRRVGRTRYDVLLACKSTNFLYQSPCPKLRKTVLLSLVWVNRSTFWLPLVFNTH